MPVEALRKQWDARASSAPFYPAMTFVGDHLMLGAGTRLGLAKRGLLQLKQSAEAFDEQRVAALLAVTCGRVIAPRELAHIRCAVEKQSEGQTSLALVHLALANLPKLQPSTEAAWRLSAADGLMKRGMRPGELLAAVGVGNAAEGVIVRAYDPDQPRVPAGNGRPSGQWTSGAPAGDDASAADPTPPSNAADIPASNRSQGVQIADGSDNWLQYLNPIGSAEAAPSGRPSFNGVGPNAQHDVGVALAMAAYQAHGFTLASEGPVVVNVPGFATPRVYDFVVLDPLSGTYIGVEVKTTMYDTIFFDRSQVDKDVAIYEPPGGYAPSLNAQITRVAYEAFCAYCPMINLGKASLTLRLLEAGIRVRTYQFPGQEDFE